MATTVVMERVSRWFGPVIALNDVSLTIEPGVTGLLGPNGAGKSTLLKLVTGQIRPSQGTVRVFDRPVMANPDVLACLGVCPDTEPLWEHWSARRHVEDLLRLGGFPKAEARERAAATLERVGLADVIDKKVGAFSKGMRQRVRVAQAIAHDPPFLVLDEPLTGLDPVGRREIIDLVKSLATEGRSLLVSGHVLHEMEKMTRRIVLIHRGRILAEGTLQEIRKALDQRPHHVRVATGQPRQLARELLEVPGVVSFRLGDGHADFEVVDPAGFFDRLQGVAADQTLPIQSYETTDDNLQAIFDYLVA